MIPLRRSLRLAIAAGLMSGSVLLAALGVWLLIGRTAALVLAALGLAWWLGVAAILIAVDGTAHASIGRALLRRIGGGS